MQIYSKKNIGIKRVTTQLVFWCFYASWRHVSAFVL